MHYFYEGIISGAINLYIIFSFTFLLAVPLKIFFHLGEKSGIARKSDYGIGRTTETSRTRISNDGIDKW